MNTIQQPTHHGYWQLFEVLRVNVETELLVELVRLLFGEQCDSYRDGSSLNV